MVVHYERYMSRAPQPHVFDGSVDNTVPGAPGMSIQSLLVILRAPSVRFIS